MTDKEWTIWYEELTQNITDEKWIRQLIEGMISDERQKVIEEIMRIEHKGKITKIDKKSGKRFVYHDCAKGYVRMSDIRKLKQKEAVKI